jgi:D-alanine-D-alanine ligase-like ATP-grasp enzyme
MPPEAQPGGWRLPGPDARPFHRLLARAAEVRGARLELEPRFGHVARLVWPDGVTMPIFGNALGLNGDAAAALAADKTYTAQVLAEAGLPVPSGILAVSGRYRTDLALKNARAAAALPEDDAPLRWAASGNYPVFIKPNRGAEGAGVSRATTESQLAADLEALFAIHTHVRIERACPGRDLRVLVLEGCVRAAYTRAALSITGDGARTVADLIALHLSRLASDHRGAKLRADDPRIARSLASEGLDPAFVPAPGRIVPLLPGANLSTGGQAEDVTDRLPAATARLAERAAGLLGLRLAGVDLLLPAPDLSPEGGTVLEVNSAPGVDFYATSGAQTEARALALLADALSALKP